jgi:ABC-type transporter MlaC component
MKYKAILVCIAALAVAAASTAAQAAKPVSKERQAAIAKIANNHRNLKQPRTVAEAERTKLVQADGTVQVAVPTELWNELSARKDAQGNLQVSETDGTAVAASTVEVEAHE